MLFVSNFETHVPTLIGKTHFFAINLLDPNKPFWCKRSGHKHFFFLLLAFSQIYSWTCKLACENMRKSSCVIGNLSVQIIQIGCDRKKNRIQLSGLKNAF